MVRASVISAAFALPLSVWGGVRAADGPGPVPAASPGIESVRRLLEENLRASGVEDADALAGYEKVFQEKLGKLTDRIRASSSPYRRARRLHEALHAGILRRYNATADGLNAVLDRGEYNCVSATLLYGIAARALGLDPQVVESPRHIFVRLVIDDRDVDIECTSPRGFDLRRDLEVFRRFVLAYKYATPEEMKKFGPAAIFEEFHGLGKPVSLEQATAFLWHNTGERALDQGDGPKAAACFLNEFRVNSNLAFRSDRLGVYMARAFRMEYEEGRFDTAYQIAEIELEIFPDRTTARDRFLAAAAKRIETACEDGTPGSAEETLNRAGATIAKRKDLVRLERETCPKIAAAAVRAGDWALAHRMAERFAVAEPDTVEGLRFRAWVESRELEGSTLALEEVCTDPRHSSQAPGNGTYGASPGPH